MAQGKGLLIVTLNPGILLHFDLSYLNSVNALSLEIIFLKQYITVINLMCECKMHTHAHTLEYNHTHRHTHPHSTTINTDPGMGSNLNNKIYRKNNETLAER